MRVLDIMRMYKKRDSSDSSTHLFTSFGENLDKNHPLPDYPRPNLIRDSYFNLNGYWDFSICKDAFLSGSDPKEPDSYQGKIIVPFSPESVLSEVNQVVYPNDALWYHTTFICDNLPSSKRCILHFGAVDQICSLFINHQKVCTHVGGYLPFSCDITNFMVSGKNHISLLVRDFTDTSYHARGKQKLQNGGMFYQCQSGIWQTVWYEFVPETYIKNLLIDTDFDQRKVSFKIDLSTIDEKNITDNHISDTLLSSFSVSVFFRGNLIYQNEDFSLKDFITISDFYPWSPESPNLYDVHIKLGDDFVESYFAFRCVHIVKECNANKTNSNIIYLNHEPYFMNGILDQGYWPDGLYTPASYKAYEKDILEMKKCGFNMIRKHIKIEPLLFYYLCDKLGMLVWQDMVNGGTDYHLSVALSVPMGAILSKNHLADNHYRFTARNSLDGRREWLKECKLTVQLLSFFPSIVCWVPFNEGWGQFDAIKVANLVHRLDPTRLIDHASGWFDQGGGNFKSEHNYFKKLRVHSDEDRSYVLSEFGGIVYRVEDHSFRVHTFGYQTCRSIEEFQSRFQELMREIEALKKDGLSASVYTQLSDVEEEMNGIMTYDRKVNKLIKGV